MGGIVLSRKANAQATNAQLQAQSQEIAQLQAQQAAAPAAPAAPAEDPMMAQLQKLSALHSAGILSDEEFAAAKAKALGI